MPLPPLPDNSTVRVWVKYTSVGVVHELMFRLPPTSSISDAQDKAAELADILATRMDVTDSVLSARRSPAGSEFSVPIDFSPVPGILSTGLQAVDPESVQLSLTGRSTTDGRKATWEFFSGAQFGTWPAKNRFLPGDNAPIDTFRLNFKSWVETSSSPGLQVVTIGNTIPTVNPYVNVRHNSYWQTAQR